MKSRIYKIGQKFKHKEFGFIGELVCINWWDNSHIISFYDGKKEKDYSYGLIINPPIIKWYGAEYQIEEKFELL